MTLLLPLLLLPPTRTLVVGGGPSRRYNQVAIESNVRYLARTLPKEWPLRILFADGSAENATVRYVPEGGREGRDDKYRKPELPRLDGPARLDTVWSEIAAYAEAAEPAPTLLYFTGHGSLAPDLSPATSQFDLWRRNRITVPQLAQSLAAFNPNVPVTLLMVQCHSGGFAKLIFKNGDPSQPPIANRFCGFYASIESRPAAGCTPAVNEAYYRDFTTYFVAALTGADRLGRKTTGADYDKDGKVGMNEAFCWSMLNDDSIDTPVCTSDEFLRQVVKTADVAVFATPYADVLKWASPAQRAALEGLSAMLKLQGNDRLASAFAKYAGLDDEDDEMEHVRGFRFLRIAKSVVLGHQMEAHPNTALRKRYEQLLTDESANPLRS